MYVTIDIETTGLNRFKDSITFIGLGESREIGGKIVKGYILDMSKSSNIFKLKNLMAKYKLEGWKTILQNGKFDTLFIEHKYNIKMPISHDVMLMATAYDLADKHGLKYMAHKYLGVEDWDISNSDKLNKKDGSSKALIPYLKKDVRYTWELFCYFYRQMEQRHWQIYTKLLRPAYLMYRDVERVGIYFDTEEYLKVKKKYQEIEKEKLEDLNKHYKINWNSPQQKAKVLFLDKKGENLPIIEKTGTGAPSSSAAVLKRLASQGYELPAKMLEYTSANTLNKMFLKRWGDDSTFDGRIHPSFNLTNVVSGRTSCTDPNLQQVPRTKDVRSLFHAPEGRCFFEADYSQLELRIAAHYSKDPAMLRIYKEEGDIHTETAMLMTNGREPTKEERNKAKAVNFGFLYGMGAKKFVEYAFDSYGAVFTLPEATQFRELFFQKYARLLPWHQEQRQLAEALGGVPNLFGRFRRLPDIYSNNWKDKGAAERVSINTPVQGTGSDILLSAAIQIHKELTPYGLNIVGTVHDSILGEFNEEDKDWIVPRIKEIMAHPKIMDEFGVNLMVKLDSDCGVGKWGTH